MDDVFGSLMERLEISIVTLNKVCEEESHRVEAEFFQRKYKDLKDKLSTFECKPLAELVLKKIQTGHTPSMKNPEFYNGQINFVKTDNLRNDYISKNFENTLSEKGNNEIKRTSLQVGDIITTIIGATYDVIARSALVDDSILPANINQNIAHIRINPKLIKPEYVSAYLNCKYGKMYLEYLSRQMEQVNLNCEEVGKVPVPIVNESIQNDITGLVKRGYSLQHDAEKVYKKAEELLLHILGLDSWNPQKETLSIRSIKDIIHSSRIDAEYYLPKYDELMDILYKFPCKTLGEIALLKKSIEPGSDAYQDFGVPFYRVGNLSKDGLSDTDIFLDEEKYYTDELSLKGNTILFSKDGSIGIAYKVEENEKAITSGAILHLSVIDEDVLPDYLTLVLNSQVVKLQAERDAGGSIIQHWKPDQISNVVIPIIDKNTQNKLIDHIQESAILRKKSKQLLEIAKQIVEIAIEAGEKEALIFGEEHKDEC